MNDHFLVRNLHIIGNLIWSWSPYIIKQRSINISPSSSSWTVDDDPSIIPSVDISDVWSEPHWAASALDEPQWPGHGGYDEAGPPGGEAGAGAGVTGPGQTGAAGAGPQPGHLPCPEAGAREAQGARGGEHWPGQEVPQPHQQPVQVRWGLRLYSLYKDLFIRMKLWDSNVGCI